MDYMQFLGAFLFYYPVVMSIFWIIGGIFFYFRREYQQPHHPQLDNFPLVSILVPARNEEQDIEDTVRSIFTTEYPNFEVIVINDASTDNTLSILRSMQLHYPTLRVLNLITNLGKANALNHALPMTAGDIILTIDADSMLDPWAIHWGVWHFENFPRVGAVTGNPRVRNRSSLLAKIQTAEYSSVIGLIKRTQRLVGKVMTVSGVIAAWRKRALVEVGGWSTDMITDDIDMTWKLEKKFWDIRYEANMLCWMLVPESFYGLWRQRKRWAQGGMEVIRKHANIFMSYKNRRLWPLYLDYCLGICWAYSFVLALIVFLLSLVISIDARYSVHGNPFPFWNGSVVAIVCLLQFCVSLMLDSRYDNRLYKLYFWVIWYPVVYWVYNSLAVVGATPAVITKKFGKDAIWTSPDRGIRGNENATNNKQ